MDFARCRDHLLRAVGVDDLTYYRAPPQPDQFVGPGGKTVLTSNDIVAGKAGFQKADLRITGASMGWAPTLVRITQRLPLSG
jgi:nitric oxide reductase large subunit